MKPTSLRSGLALCSLLAAALAGRGAADYATPYLFSTLAGVSSIGSQDGAGAAARFYSPRAVATDAAGNAFVVDNGNHTIRKVTPAGLVTTLAGSPGIAGSADGTGAAARFNGPTDIVADSADNLYVTDTRNHTIRKITPAGVVTTVAGLAGVPGNVDGAGTAARLNEPLGLAIDPAGMLYLTESGNRAIRKITAAGVVSTMARELAFTDPYYYAIAVDAAGNAYVTRYITRDYQNYYINGVLQGDEIISDIGYLTKVAPDGTLTYLKQSTVIIHHPEGTIPPINTPFTDVLVEAGGQLVLAASGQIVRFSPADSTTTVISGSGIPGSADGDKTTARFGGLLGLAVDRNGTFHVADGGNNDFRKVTPAGAAITVAGLALDVASGFQDGAGTEARFQLPAGVAVDAAGNIYLADSFNHCIRKVTPAGVVSLLAGSPGAAGAVDGMVTAARFSNPRGVAVDATGAVFVADRDNRTIRRVSPAGEVSTYAGVAGSQGTQDGDASTARFTYPQGVAVDAAGNVYVTDDAVVRKITPAREVSTLAGHPSVAGSNDGIGSDAEFTAPTGITVDAGGNVYVTEAPYNPAIARVRKISATGIVTTLAGGSQGSADGNGTAARFNQPTGLAVDGSGNLFIADSRNQTIRKLTPQGTVTTLAGLADTPGSSDATGAEARFYYPQGVAVNAAGTLYVSNGTTLRKGILALLPTIATQPASLSVTAGNSATFSVTAGGTPAPTYQWQRNGAAVSGATGSSLSLSNVQSGDAGDYTVVVTNALGSVTSAKATLAVTAAPVPPPSAPSGGGGGGAPSGWFLLALLALGAVRRLHRSRAG